jgi:Domain of unknown function (DUF3859)
MRRLLPFALSIVASLVACATAGFASSIKIVEYGIYTAEVKVPATGANETRKSAGLVNICHVMTTSIVPARDDLQFGFRFRVYGPAPGSPVMLKKVVTWPDHGKPPTTPETNVTRQEDKKVRVGHTSYTGWINAQARPGIWTFQLFEWDRKLAEMVFTVVGPDDFKVTPEGASTCSPREVVQ